MTPPIQDVYTTVENRQPLHIFHDNRIAPEQSFTSIINNKKKMIFEVYTIYKNLFRQFHELRTSVYYLLVFLLLWITIFSYKVDKLLKRDIIKNSNAEWISCIFSNFQTIQTNQNNYNIENADLHWKNACGIKPKIYVRVLSTAFYLFILNGHSILLAFIFLPAVRLIWFTWLSSFIKKYRKVTTKLNKKKKSSLSKWSFNNWSLYNNNNNSSSSSMNISRTSRNTVTTTITITTNLQMTLPEFSNSKKKLDSPHYENNLNTSQNGKIMNGINVKIKRLKNNENGNFLNDKTIPRISNNLNYTENENLLSSGNNNIEKINEKLNEETNEKAEIIDNVDTIKEEKNNQNKAAMTEDESITIKSASGSMNKFDIQNNENHEISVISNESEGKMSNTDFEGKAFFMVSKITERECNTENEKKIMIPNREEINVKENIKKIEKFDCHLKFDIKIENESRSQNEKWMEN